MFSEAIWFRLGSLKGDNTKDKRGLGKSMVVYRLFEKPRHSNERSTKFES